ncbi:hypothetical protein WJX84_009583 [Apatococcus fuscideae]|uniref:N-acetyltransferase domain-containing protein n=1 Tax=Apatococcus fuscideae TaxID=2026836 RepID=A0AAW1SXJ4_9CHLO
MSEPAKREQSSTVGEKSPSSFSYRQYRGEEDLHLVRGLIDVELSEPYSIFTYKYFLHHWPQLCVLAFDGSSCFGTIVCKLDQHGEFLRGYIAMLVVEQPYRKLGIGSELVKRAVKEMKDSAADEVVLEAETNNHGALALYQNLGFIRDKRLHRYYLSGTDAFRLKLLLPLPPERLAAEQLSAMQLQAASQPASPDPDALLDAAADASRAANPEPADARGQAVPAATQAE